MQPLHYYLNEPGKYPHKFLRGSTKHSRLFDRSPLRRSKLATIDKHQVQQLCQPIFLLPKILISIVLPCSPARRSTSPACFFSLYEILSIFFERSAPLFRGSNRC